MKKYLIISLLAICSFGNNGYSFDLNDILGKAGSALGGVVDGLLTKTDITVADMAGTWTATGSAVSFQSDNALKKAGGAAAASTIEEKLDPYYKKLGLIGSTLTVDKDGNFSLKVKSVTLKGTIKKRTDGNFDFVFSAFGKVNLGTITAYVQKPLSGLDIMFDATKLKNLLSTIAGLTGNSLATTAGNLLSSYDGLCVGFSYKK